MEQIYAEGEDDHTIYLLANGQVVGASQKKSVRIRDEGRPQEESQIVRVS